MELQEDTVCQERWCDAQLGGESVCDRSNLCLPLHSGHHADDDNIFINSLTPPLPSLPNLHAERNAEIAGDYASTIVISDTQSDVLLGMNEDPLWMSKTEAVWPVSVTPHQCSHCSKAFGSVSALHKHQLTHQQDRPHECSVCKRGFKRSDHLNVHILTHQKRKQFRSSKPAYQKSYCDNQLLKYHCAPSPSASTFCDLSKTSPTQWKGQFADGDPLLGNLTDGTNYHSIFLSPPKAASDTQLCGTGSACLNSCGDYTSFTSLGDSGAMSFSRSSVTKVLDPWSQGENRGFCDGDDNEPNPPLVTCGAPKQNPDKKPESNTFVGPQYGESDVNIPVSKLQALEEILLFQPFREEQSLGENIPAESASPKRLKQSHCAVIFKQAPCRSRQEFKRKSPLGPEPHSLSVLKGSAFSETMSAPNAMPDNTDDPVLNGSDQAQSAHSHVPVMLPSVFAASYSYDMVQPEAPSVKSPKNDSRKRARKTKVKETNLPAPPHPLSRPSMHYAPRCPRLRPLDLISPSQVALASFGAVSAAGLTSRLPFKVKNSGDQLDTCNSKQALLQPSEDSIRNLPLGESSWTSAKEDFAEQMQGKKMGSEAGHLQVQKAPCVDDKISVMPLVIPVSVPVSERTQEGKGLGSTRASKKSRNLKFRKTLFIPSPTTAHSYMPRDLAGDTMGVQRWWAAGAYPSQLRSPVYLGDHLLNPSFEPPPYTPPPMLSPLRPGTGLYFSTLPPTQPCPPPPPPSTYTATLDMADGISLVMDDTVVTIEPRINVGSRFQAEIPPLQNLPLILYDEHPAQLVWAPWGDIDSNTETEERVTALLDLSCSSVLPGGGTNTELALHCLHEGQGDVLAALELLLIKEDYLSSSYPLRNYHYSGSDYWSPQERRLFCKALVTHGKNFQLIQNMLQNKSAAQCVEYYYAMKKLQKFKQRIQGAARKDRLTEPIMELPGGQVECSVKHGASQKHLRPARAQVLPARHIALKYVCEVCGRGFEKVKSRSAHMKTHRNQEREFRDPCYYDEVHL
ncbi:zinc finger protein 541 isoform X2 [Brienomyrus brachyistius]|uniref:zinc finger protein 541 isoform X2 n=1 Tax=Brienomyrus brachyistius TaxID=42636 RepID=UPI0020B392DC|nr:zinc finger protein 541 isoform X2 [Brienomyrus brachyistius]